MDLCGCMFEIIVLGSAIAAVVMNALMVISCEFFELRSRGITRGSLGLWKFQNPLEENFECVDLTEIAGRNLEDRAFRCASISSLLSFGFSAILLVYLFSKQCLCKLPLTNTVMDVAATCVQISLALVYFLWLSEACSIYECVNGEGAFYLIATQVLWVIVGCFSRCMTKRH